MSHHEYVVRLDRDNLSALAAIRGVANIFVYPEQDHIWVRGQTSGTTFPPELAALPGNHYQLGKQNALISPGHRLATAWLADPQWVPLTTWLDIQACREPHWNCTWGERRRR